MLRILGLSACVVVCALSCRSGEPPRDAKRAKVVVEVPAERSADHVADGPSRPEPESETSDEERQAAAVVPVMARLPPVSDSTAPPGTECRSPDQPGCNPCLVPMRNGGCEYHAWMPFPNPTKERIEEFERKTGEKLVPVYNVSASLPKCPEHYGHCARCSVVDEMAARSMHERPECDDVAKSPAGDCSRDTGIDPCFAADSCECWCIRAAAAKDHCPDFFGKGKQ